MRYASNTSKRKKTRRNMKDMTAVFYKRQETWNGCHNKLYLLVNEHFFGPQIKKQKVWPKDSWPTNDFYFQDKEQDVRAEDKYLIKERLVLFFIGLESEEESAWS